MRNGAPLAVTRRAVHGRGVRRNDPESSIERVTAAGDRAGIRFLEFFASAIRNPHTRRAYARAAGDFLAWCAGASVTSITEVQPLHVAAWIERQTQTHAAPTVKQRLAAIRHLFDWLVTGQIVPQPGRVGARSQSHHEKGQNPGARCG
ncbi:MAG: hypothetical protein QOC89_2075 [Paraburkholderia sp.]|nr:hypothetical protein [Paraburkholderia sp.]